MPFLNEITQFINDTLKAGSLNKEKLQPAKFYGTTSLIAIRKGTVLETMPGIIDASGKATPITPDSKLAIQVYHRLYTNTYAYVKKSFGDAYDIKSTSDLAIIVLTNSKITGETKDVLEPVVLFGIPQKLSKALRTDLKLINCLITPVASNLDHIQVFRQEFPQSDYTKILNEQMSIFLIRYKVELQFSQACIDMCLCGQGEFTNEFSDEYYVDS